MANTLTTIDMVAREALRVAHENLTFLTTIDQSYDSSYAKAGAKIGDTLRVRDPNQYTRRTGSRVMDVQDQQETTQAITVATQDGVDMKFNSAELLLSIDELSKRYIEPAVKVLVAGIEGDVLTDLTQSVHQLTGTAGTVVGASADISALGAARAKLNMQLAPGDNRSAQFDSVTMASIVNGTQLFFHPGGEISKGFTEGFIGRNSMATFFENEKTRTQTNTVETDVIWLVDDTTRLATGDAAVGNSINILNFDEQGSTAKRVVGEVFTIAGLFDCHPETKQQYSHLKQLTVTASGTVTSNNGTITFSPPIIVDGAKQNVFTSTGDFAELEDNATVLYGGSGEALRQNLMYARDFATFVTADLPLMDDALKTVRRVQDGLSLRVWQGSDIRNDELLLRIDILYGWKILRPEWAVRISN